jgi:hypothetical protein
MATFAGYSFDADLHTFRSSQFLEVVNEAIRFFLNTPTHKLPPPVKFTGAGVYSLYYVGEFPLYKEISACNQSECSFPIYVGKAVPTGWRTGRERETSTTPLFTRLNQHRASIDIVKNLELEDFRCRFMILKNIEADLIVPVEAELIRKYTPLWNAIIDGFGNHDPGSGRYDQAKSEWDVLHLGRKWAEKLRGVSPKHEDIVNKIRSHLVK